MSDIIPVIALFGGLFIALPTIRLLYVEPQYDGLATSSKNQKKVSDDALGEELQKDQPEKEKVLSFANEIAAHTKREKSIKETSSSNRLQVLLDIAAFIIIAFLGVAIYENMLLQYQAIIGMIAFMVAFFSIITFVGHYMTVHNLKKRMDDSEDQSVAG